MSELQHDERNDVVVVRFNHQTIIANTVIEKVGNELLALVDRVDRKLLLDFKGVTHMSSAMIGKVLLLHKNCESAKVRLKLCNRSVHQHRPVEGPQYPPHRSRCLGCIPQETLASLVNKVT